MFYLSSLPTYARQPCPALKLYHQLRDKQRAEEASQCGSFLRRSSLDKYNLDKNTNKLEEKSEEGPDPTPTLVHLIELSNPGWLTWFLSKLRCF